MINCPICSAENIPGEDECIECGGPLVEHLPTPGTLVEQGLVTDRLRELSPKQPHTVAPDTVVREVLQQMVDRSIGCVIVVDNGKAVGIFSERDALLKLSDEVQGLMDRPVSEFMTPSPQTLDSTAKIAFAVRSMDMGSYRHVPIVDEEGLLTGVISVRDILRYLTEKMTAAES
jgi:CBS domain-containing protein